MKELTITQDTRQTKDITGSLWNLSNPSTCWAGLLLDVKFSHLWVSSVGSRELRWPKGSEATLDSSGEYYFFHSQDRASRWSPLQCLPRKFEIWDLEIEKGKESTACRASVGACSWRPQKRSSIRPHILLGCGDLEIEKGTEESAACRASTGACGWTD
jgi:hypothetical protein